MLKNHENDFISAYQGHMKKVKEELTFLMKRAKEAAMKASNDDSITKLQNQIKWF